MAPPPDDPHLTCRGLAVAFGDRQVLDDVTLTVSGGEIVWVTGPNGAGKSTLLRALIGLVPSEGEVRIAGLEPDHTAARSSFFYVADRAVLYEDLTADEHLHFTAMLYERPDSLPRMRAWIERFRLQDRVDEFPVDYSRGMQRKLELSMALGLGTPLLLLDEPFDGLDHDAQDALREGLRSCSKEGSGVLMTTHQAVQARDLEVRRIEVEGGRLREAAGLG